MKSFTKPELAAILIDHELWLSDDSTGKRASLRWADLCGADLYGVNLRDADLREANLYGANLSEADLRGANLSEVHLHGANLRDADLREANLYGADLHGANLREANLHGANLREANLYGANLRWANLSEADLRGANLSEADLHGANLRDADLSRANLYGANLSEAKAMSCPLACPEEGSFIGFKKTRNDLIVKLEIPADALRCSSTGRKCRCSKAKVLSITNLDSSESEVTSAQSNRDGNFFYTIGKTVEVSDFDQNRWNECSTGIHFFITRQEAVDYMF